MGTQIIKEGDTVVVVAQCGGMFERWNAGKQGVVTRVAGRGIDDRVYVKFDNDITDYGHVGDVVRVQTKQPRKVKPMKNPEYQGKVFRVEVLYKDNTSFKIGGIKHFDQNTTDSEGNDCLCYTKAVNDDVEGKFYVKRTDLAALVLRYDNGKTEIFEYSDKVIDVIALQIQKAPTKKVLTAEEAENRRVKRAGKAAKRKEDVDAKEAAKKAD